MLAPFSWPAPGRSLVMGILNATPDSFSDGGRYADPGAAIAAGLRMVGEGADLLDIGGESTRPGAIPVEPQEERRRVIPVLRGLREAGVPLSIDTRNAATMAAALDEGAMLVNDVSALLHDPVSAALIAARDCPVILMHMRGTPVTMAEHAHYTDVVAEVTDELAHRIAAACRAGIRPERIAVDPGFGFAKTAEHSLLLLRGLRALGSLGCPVVAGVSRKRFVRGLAGGDDPAASAAAAVWAAARGAAVLRVHDVAATVQALRVWQALTA